MIRVPAPPRPSQWFIFATSPFVVQMPVPGPCHAVGRGEFSLIFFPIYYGFIRRFEVQSAYFLVTKATLKLLKSVHFVNYIKI